MDKMDPDFREFPSNREISEEIIEKLITDKIDPVIIPKMEQEQLEPYLPKLGDRIAVIDYCRRMANEKCSRKQGLLNKLRLKIKRTARRENPSSEEEDCSNKYPKKNSKKVTRQIEIGWLCSTDGNRHIQIRTKQGGGTRKLDVPRDAKKQYILERAKELFFPEGISPKGKREDFSFDLWDFKQNPLKIDLTIEEMFNISGLCRLRFYLATTQKTCTVTSSENSSVIEEVLVDDLFQESIQKIQENPQLGLDNLYQNLVEEAVKESDFITELPFSHFLEGTDQDRSTIWGTDNDLHTLPYSDPVEIIVHRGHVMDELIEIGRTLEKHSGPLHIMMVLPNGQAEAAFDSGGVYRDCLAEFWSTFYEKCTVGTKHKVPYLRHDFDEVKWTSVARILYRGWKDHRYFPSSISPVFMEYCIFEKVLSNLKDSFLNYLSASAKDTIATALENFESVSNDDLADVMEELECKYLLNSENFEKCITDISHKELIQKPMFIIDCWATVLKNILSSEELKEIYENYDPTSKNVLKVLYCCDDDIKQPDAKRVFGFLKKYIKESTNQNLKKFLRFCTGADLLTGNIISVSFNKTIGLLRRPIARTCGCILELSDTYQTFTELRTEFNEILNSNIWIMDFV